MSERAARTFFGLTTVFTAMLGVSWFVAPGTMLGQWGVPAPDAAALYVARRYATMFFGYSVLLWLAREATGSPAGRAICAGGAVVTGVMAVVTLQGLNTGVVTGPMVWSAAVAEVLLAAGFVAAWRRR